MATHDYVLDNATGQNFRSDLNNALAAIVSNNSSSSEPSTKYAYQWWADTNEGVLKIRNSANDGWVTLLQLDGTLTLEDGTNSAPALGFRDDLNTGIFSSAADNLDITTGGTTRVNVSSTGINVTGTVVDDGATHDGDVTFTGASANIVFDKSDNALEFADNAIAKFGDSGDLQIDHDSSTGQNIIQASAITRFRTNSLFSFQNSDGSEAILKGTPDSSVDLFFNGVKKAETVSGGFTVTGTCTATAFAGDGSALTGISAGGTTINNNADNRVITGSGTANTLNAETDVVIDSSNRVIVGTSTSRSVGDVTAQIQVEGTGFASSSLSLMSNAGATAGNVPHIILGKSRGSSDGSNTAVVDGDKLGVIQFAGADGTDCNSVAAAILAKVDATVGSNDMAGLLQFQTTSDGAATPSDRMVIDKDGKVGIGSHSGIPNTKVDVGLGVFAATGDDDASDWGTDVFQLTATGGNAANNQVLITGAHSGGVGQIASGIGFGRDSTTNWGTYISFKTHPTTTSNIDRLVERLKILSNGDMVLGGSAVEAQGAITFEPDRDDGSGRITFNRADTSSVSICIEMQNNNSQSGRIEYDNSTCGIFSSSDYRLKENVVALSNAVTRLKTLKPYKFNFIADATKTVDGFFAHEVSSVVPEAISGEKDGVDSENKPVYQAIDQSKLVPLIVAAVQELVTRVETLEAA